MDTKGTGIGLLHKIDRELCPKCHRLMIAYVDKEKVEYECIYKECKDDSRSSIGS